MIEKTSELGVDRIIPFFSERTVVRLDSERQEKKTRHWREIAKNAAKQANRIKPAEIERPVLFQDLIRERDQKEGIRVIMWEGEEEKDLKTFMRSVFPAKRFIGIVGPEGGFSEEEIELAVKASFNPVSVGERILRAETAAISLVAVVQYEWGDLNLLSAHP